jgi:hypothetical protein
MRQKEEGKMRFIPTRIHGVLDYIIGIILIIAPWLLGFNSGGAETVIPVIFGAGIIIYSLFTDYELGAVRAIPMRTHLTIDVIAGIVLAASPWLFNFDYIVIAPHLILGLVMIAAGLTTQTVPIGCRTC